MQSGYIKALQIQRKKELQFENVQSIEVEAGKGIIGDCHCFGGEKQVTLVSFETKQWIQLNELEGLCLQKFQENIVTGGLDYSLLREGDLLETENVRIELSNYTKKCFMNCNLVQNKQPCQLKTGVKFAKVVKSGIVKVNDIILKI